MNKEQLQNELQNYKTLYKTQKEENEKLDLVLQLGISELIKTNEEYKNDNS